MGNQESHIQYSMPISEKKEGETAIYRNPKSVNKLKEYFDPNVTNLQQMIELSHKQLKDNQFIGRRDSTTNEYVYTTYGEEYNDARSIGSAILTHKLANFVEEGIFSKNRPEWNTVDMGCTLYGITTIPLFETLGPESISYVLYNSSISSCFCTNASISTILKSDKLHHLQNIISFDPVSQDDKNKLKDRGLNLYLFSDLLKEGASNLQDLPNSVTSETIVTFSYTSGTTGNPKGAMISHKNILGIIANMGEAQFYKDDVQLCYLPLPHILQRGINFVCWYTGCTIAFYNGDILKLKQDIIDVKPTVLFSVPRLFNRFYDAINDQLNQITGLKKILIDRALNTKLYNLRNYCQYTHAIYDKIIFKKLRDAFGGRVRYCFTGSAPISKDVLDFFKVIFSCPFYEAYGQTEGLGLEFLTSKLDKDSSGKVGGIVEHLEFKLLDVPEMYYFSTDKNENGVPQPRGEICIRGSGVFKGYFRDVEKTKEAIDDEKWLHSGDIGALLPDGALKIIDRKKNIFKLSQGEYVAPERVENIYTRSRGVAESFVYGDSMQNYCVAIVVVNPDEVKKIAIELNLQSDDIQQLSKEPEVIKFYLKTLSTDGKKNGLFSFEIPQKIYLEPKPFQLSGICTSSLKLQRFQAKEFYKDIIKQLYSSS